MADTHPNPLFALILVRQLHQPRLYSNDHKNYELCCECRQTWPCQTERAILQAADVPTPQPHNHEPELKLAEAPVAKKGKK